MYRGEVEVVKPPMAEESVRFFLNSPPRAPNLTLPRKRGRELEMTLASDYLLARGCQLDRSQLDVTGAAVGGHDDAVC